MNKLCQSREKNCLVSLKHPYNTLFFMRNIKPVRCKPCINIKVVQVGIKQIHLLGAVDFLKKNTINFRLFYFYLFFFLTLRLV